MSTYCCVSGSRLLPTCGVIIIISLSRGVKTRKTTFTKILFIFLVRFLSEYNKTEISVNSNINDIYAMRICFSIVISIITQWLDHST